MKNVSGRVTVEVPIAVFLFDLLGRKFFASRPPAAAGGCERPRLPLC